MPFQASEIEYLRHKCRTDLYFLAKEILKKDVEPQPHQEVCDFFVHKDPDKHPYDLDSFKHRLLLLPRGSFKSSLDVVDAVQWILAYPNIRILILTAERNLATAFAEEVRSYFVEIKDAPTDLQLLFPEYCIPESSREASNQFTTPARTRYYKEPTIWANSIGSNLPGWHCDVLKLDDTVNDLNTTDPDQIAKVTSRFSFARKLVDPGGYIDVVGTPYSPDDLYAYIQQKDDPTLLRTMVRPAWTLKEGSKAKPEKDLTAEDYDLFFPARLTYDYLKKEREFDNTTFESQYLMNAYANTHQLFSERVLHNAILPWQTIPPQVKYYCAWDLAYGTERMHSDETAGAVCAVDSQGRKYIVDLVHGRWTGSEIAMRIADMVRRYPIQLLAIEDNPGARWLESEILRACQHFGVRVSIFWMPVERGKDAKKSRIVALEPKFRESKLFFSSGCPNLEDILEAFKRYTGSRNSHDDIPDVISFFQRLVREPGQTQITEAQVLNAQDEALMRLIFPERELIEEPAPLMEEWDSHDPIVLF